MRLTLSCEFFFFFENSARRSMRTTTSTPDTGVDEVVSFSGFVTRASGPFNKILLYVVQTFAWVEASCTARCAPRGIMCNLQSHTELHANNCAHLSNSMSRSIGSLCVVRPWRAPSTRSVLAPYDFMCVPPSGSLGLYLRRC